MTGTGECCPALYPFFCVKKSHQAERSMACLPLNLKIIMPADIIQKSRVGRAAYWGQVEFHLYPADAGKVFWFDEPFSTFAVAFQKVTATGKGN